MKFRDFLLKRILANSDYLVGYDAEGRYIRISKDDLISSIAAGVTIPTLHVQYSANGDSWHDSYGPGDHYLRVKAGAGAWSGAIQLSVSAYDIWREQGNDGTEEDFIKSLKGEPGDVDFSGLRLRDINGYTDLLNNVNESLQNAKNAIISDVVKTAVNEVKNQYAEMQLSDIDEINNLKDKDCITVVTKDGLRKVRISTLIDNVALRILRMKSEAGGMTPNTQHVELEVSGERNGSNAIYEVNQEYFSGTSNLFLNGQRLVLGEDYEEHKTGFTMLSYLPVPTDSLVFLAVVF